MDENTKKINKILYILVIFSLICMMIYFKDGIFVVPIGIFTLLFMTVIKKLNKDHKYFGFLVVGILFLFGSSDVHAATPNFTVNQIKDMYYKAQSRASSKSNYRFDDGDKDFLIFYDKYAPTDQIGAGRGQYDVRVCSGGISYDYNHSTDIFDYSYRSCDHFHFNSNIQLDENGYPVEGTYYFKYSGGAATHSPYCDNGEISTSVSKCTTDFKVMYANHDIVFEGGGLTSDWHKEFYNSSEDEIYNEFGYNLGNVEGYTYIDIMPKEQIVLYPKVSAPFDFYLFFQGGISVDILNSTGSDINLQTHYNKASQDFYYQKLNYNLEDEHFNRGVFVTNFASDNSILKLGYDANIFEVLYFNGQETVSTADGTVTFSNTYDLIKKHNNIDDTGSSGGGSGFSSLIGGIEQYAKDLVQSFKVIGVLFGMFFSTMPDFIVEGFKIILFFIVLKTIVDLWRG